MRRILPDILMCGEGGRGGFCFADVGYFADKVVKTNMDASVSGLAINQIINGLSAARQDL